MRVVEVDFVIFQVMVHDLLRVHKCAKGGKGVEGVVYRVLVRTN